MAQRVRRLPERRETSVPSLGQEDPLEKEMAAHSSTLAWKVPWTEECSRLQSIGLQRIGHDYSYLAAAASVTDGKESTCNARDLGSVHGVSKSQI